MVNTKQIIGSYIVPFSDSVSLNKAAFDIENPQVRKTDFTKSIVIPSTTETNKLFENLFDVKVALQTFNPNLKTTYELVIDGISVMRGYCQLIDIRITNGKIDYVLNAKGAIGDLFSSIGDALVEDLNFATYNHTWNKTNIEASWTPTLGQGYVYPMIDYGTKNGQDFWRVEEFKPALFVREYLLKIFTAAGYTWTSAFLDSTRFKSLIIPQSSDVVSLGETSIENRQFLADRLTLNQTGILGHQYDISSMTQLIFNDVTSPFYNTSGNDLNLTTGTWACAVAGKYSLKALLKLSFTYTPPTTQEQNFIQGVIDTLTDAYLNVYVVRLRGGNYTIIDTMSIELFSVLDGAVITNPYTSSTFTAGVASADMDFKVGDEISIRLGSLVLNGFQTAFLYGAATSYTMYTTSQFGNIVRQKQIAAGETMTVNDTLPQDVKQSDFVNAIIKRFNLYMEYDSDNDKNIIIEPLNDFITSTVQDVNGWVNNLQEKVVKPLGALKNGKFLFTDKEDKDIYNTIYQDTKGETYGTYNYYIDNDFQTGEKRIETIFAPCPLWSAVRENDRIISTIAFPRALGGYAEEMALPKLLYWGGLLDTDVTWYLDEDATLYTQTQYPYAGHLDNPYNPQFDLNWGVPKSLYYDFSYGGLTDLLYTDKNCFNLYWKQYIQQITDKDSKILEVYMVLDSHRYDLLTFRKLYFIDGVYWRLLEIQDFNPLSGEAAKCIFISLTDKDAFTGEQKKVFGGGGVFTGGDALPKNGMLGAIGNGSGMNTGVLAYGDSVSSGRQSIQNSDSVLSGSGVRQTLTSGSDGARLLAPRTAAINSPNIEITRPDEMYINGVFLEKKLEVTLTATQMKALNTSPFLIIQAPNSDEYIKITRGYIRMAGTNFATTSRLLIRTTTSESILIQTSTTFFDTSSNAEIMAVQTEVADFAESVELYQSADMTGTGSSVTITLIYQIIKF